MPTLSLPGCLRASAMKSVREPAPTFGLATTTIPLVTIWTIGVKSRTGS